VPDPHYRMLSPVVTAFTACIASISSFDKASIRFPNASKSQALSGIHALTLFPNASSWFHMVLCDQATK